ncbi:ATP-binding protein [candidate division CSSED10-310 bacterium]|uniref:ATP-binding protein n=1 Tax=candidate division CSSED10-310 bacterium TaxID=2855610 RepID=A0ABV6YVG8_UNCC1
MNDLKNQIKVIAITQGSAPLGYAVEVKIIAQKIGFKTKGLSEIGIVVSELVTNVLKYANKGTLIIQHIIQPEKGIEIIVEDEGPGFDFPDKVLTDGFSEGQLLTDNQFLAPKKSLGCGLGAVQRLMSSLSIENKSNGGARVVTQKLLGTGNER